MVLLVSTNVADRLLEHTLPDDGPDLWSNQPAYFIIQYALRRDFDLDIPECLLWSAGTVALVDGLLVTDAYGKMIQRSFYAKTVDGGKDDQE